MNYLDNVVKKGLLIRIFTFVLIVIILFSCRKDQKPDISESTGQIQTITLPYTVIDKSSLKKIFPGIDAIPQPDIIQLKYFTKESVYNNKILAGAPQLFKAGKPKVNFVGEGLFSLPSVVQAKNKPLLAGYPEAILAKSPGVPNPNPQSFSEFGKLQGLSHNVVRNIIQDRYGNLWFATNGGGVTKFDGRFFYNYTQNHGLANNTVWSLLEDRHGNIWMGTWGGGITKFDGKYFTHYTKDEGLSDNYITSLLEDHMGRIWVGTNNGGISVFADGIFSHYTQKEGLPSNNVYSLYEDKNLNIWIVSSNGGICRFDGKSFTIYDESTGLLTNAIWSVFEDSKSNIWIGTRDGVVKFDGEYYYNYTTNQGLSDNRIWVIKEDTKGNIWFGTRGGGAIMYDGLHFNHFAEKEGLNSATVLSILEDNEGNIWFGTFGSGVMKYQGNVFKHFTTTEGLPSRDFRVIMEDSKGFLWVGSWGGGVFKTDGRFVYTFNIEKGTLPGIVNAILEDYDGNIWIGTEDGVYCYDGIKLTQYTEKHGLPDKLVFQIIEDSNRNLWFGTARGVVLFDGKSFTHIIENELLPYPRAWALHEDQNGNIWIGTYGGGALRYDGNGIASFTSNEGLISDYIFSINQDINGNMWFGTNNGVTTLTNTSIKADKYFAKSNDYTNPQTFEVISFDDDIGIQGKTVANILVDKSGNIIFGTDFGLSILSANDSNNLAEMLEKASYSDSPLFRNFGFEDGFLGLGVSANNAMYETKNGEIWIATDNRLTTYYPDNLTTDDQSPVVTITKIELFNETIKWSDLIKQPSPGSVDGSSKNIAKDTTYILGNGVRVQNFRFSAVSSWFEIPENLNLAFDNNFLTFHFMGITQRQPSMVKYKYKLEGFDTHWSAITSRNTAPYGNLPHGRYTFRVKAMNSAGQWSDDSSYSFKIRPPWWLTWWFRISAAVFSIAFLLSIYKFRLANLKRRKAELEQLVEEKTIEVVQKNDALQTFNEELTSINEEINTQRDALEEALNNLKQAQKRIVHSEKMASLGVLAAGLAHEINNPLNFIKGGVVGIEEYLKDNIIEHYNELQPLVEVINVGVTRAAIIVKSLNHFNRSSDTIFTSANIHSIIDDCLIILHNKLKYKAEVIKNYTNKPYNLVCNVGRMHQSILHILTNSEQAIAQKGKITITTEIENDHLILSIEDTGYGIHPNNLPKVLDPFFTTKEPGKGSGLGLTITYSIVQEHGGSIEIESVPDIGTTVTIQLPLNRQEDTITDE
jgi:ligand-binding sensor domain-containing protein/signal transduction histidine kinase